MKRNKICFLVLLCCLFNALILSFFLIGCNPTPEDPVDIEDEYQDKEPEDPEITDPAPEEEKDPSPYTGLPVDEIFGRPYAIMIDNLPKARPQSGLKDAELVYEVPVEGGTTRFITFWLTPYDKEIGPVRSARPYFAHLAKEQDAILAHCGYSIHTEAVIREIKLKHIDERYNPLFFKRDKSRNMPHNLYTNLSRLAQGAEKFNYLQTEDVTVAPFFNFEEKEIPENIVSHISISFISHNHVEYRWNSQGKYTRYNEGKLFVDANDGEAVEVKNIIVQFADFRTFTEEGHLDVTLLGKGNGLYFSEGSVEEIVWQKDSYSEKTYFFDKNGNEIKLSKGNTWIHIVPQYGKIEWSF
ncbi:MAG TPA: DUF3048 domain-containing protein [Firmicutes bacterium]|nr:DUF3048 domain-containing protein [Bacillota bacterium]